MIIIFPYLIFLNLIWNDVLIFDQIQDYFDSVLKIIWLTLLTDLILLTNLNLFKTITYWLVHTHTTTAF
jgi:hypothetical protein